MVIGRGILITASANAVTRLLAGAITLTFFTYIFVNMGMVSGILPWWACPSRWCRTAAPRSLHRLGIGILMSIHSHKKLVQTWRTGVKS